MNNQPIKIDLADLTEEKMERAISAGRGECSYMAPCIIGTLMSAGQRMIADVGADGDTEIFLLVEQGIVQFPEGQAVFAQRLQERFDLPKSYSNKAFRSYARSVMKRFAKSPMQKEASA